jgi:hypothetical protein
MCICFMASFNVVRRWVTLLTPSFIVLDLDMTGLELDLGTLDTLAGGPLQAQPYPGPTETSPMRWIFGPDANGMLFFLMTREKWLSIP